MTVNKVIQIPFMGTILQQQTEGGLIDISAIVDLVNAKRLRQGKTEKEIWAYFEGNDSQEYLHTLLAKMGLKDNPRILGTAQVVEIIEAKELREIPRSVEGVTIIEEQEKITIKELKELELYKKTRGKYEGTWFTPLLAIDIVGWLDPEIRLYFNALVYEKLFELRITISDKIRKLTDKIVERFGKQEAHYYMMLNYHLNLKVYGSNHSDIRNESTKEEYDKMVKIIDKLVMMIEEEMFTTAESIINKIQSLKTA